MVKTQSGPETEIPVTKIPESHTKQPKEEKKVASLLDVDIFSQLLQKSKGVINTPGYATRL